MTRFTFVSALMAASLAAFPLGGAGAQTAPGGLAVPPPSGPARPASRVTAGGKASAVQTQRVAKPSAAELAEQRKLEHDLHICIGC